MFKFLRKYNKWILAVGGTLLMITFLIPFAFTELGRIGVADSTVWARLQREGTTVELTSATSHQAAAEIEILNTWLGYVEQSTFQRRQLPPAAIETSTQIRQILARQDDRKLSEEHWYLLTYEAELAGLVGGPSDGYGLLVAEDGDLVVDSLAVQASSRTGSTTRLFVQEALAKIRGVGRLLVMYRDAPHFSDRRLLAEARRLFHSVTADLVPIQALPAGSTLEPTTEQLQAQLDKYGDVEPGQGEHGFGYRLPNRVRIEWITVYATGVRNAIEGSDQLSPVELRKHWKKNEHRPEFGPADANKPVPDAVRQDLLQLLTQQRLDEIARAAQLELERSRRGITRVAGYLQLPDDWREILLGNLATSLADQFGITLPIYRTGPKPWLTEAELRDLPEISSATTTAFGSRPLDVAALAMNCRDFSGNPTYAIQARVAGPPLRHPDGSIFIWRIVATDTARAPATINEVRDDLVADLRRLDHYQSLVASLDAVRQKALTDGLLATALEHDTAVQRVSVQLCDLNEIQKQSARGLPLRAAATELPVVGSDEQFVTAIVDLGMSFPIDAVVSELPAEQRTIARAVPESLCVAVAQLVNQRPLTSEIFSGYMQFRDFSALLGNRDISMEEALFEAFNLDALTRRHQFAVVTRDNPDDAGG